jgi:quinol monooxygenase YgiN
MAATVHVVERYRAKDGREDALKSVLVALVAPARREVGCYQYDLLQNPADPRDFCFVGRWENEKAVDQHRQSEHVKKAGAQLEDLVEAPPDIRRYQIV